MITKNPMQLKAFIKKKAAEKKYLGPTCHAELYVGTLAGKNFPFPIQKEFYIERRFLDFRNRWTGYTDNYGFGYDNKRFYANP